MIEKQVWVSFELEDLEFDNVLDWISTKASDEEKAELIEMLNPSITVLNELARTLDYHGEEQFIKEFKEYINQRTNYFLN